MPKFTREQFAASAPKCEVTVTIGDTTKTFVFFPKESSTGSLGYGSEGWGENITIPFLGNQEDFQLSFRLTSIHSKKLPK